MSLWSQKLPFLSLKPKVRMEGEALTARSSLLVQLLLLFSYCKRVRVDARRQTVTIEWRFLWLFRRRKEVPFARIERILYEASDMGTSWSLFHGRTDSIERFSVGLSLTDPWEKVHLFSFTGEGSVETGWSGVIWGDDSMVDFRGDQAEASGSFVDLLQKLTGKPLV
jgi:hypothetical protein